MASRPPTLIDRYWDAMAVAEDRAGFAIEVLAARGQTAGATLALSDMHKTAGQQLVALANGNFDDSGAQSSSSGQNDPRQKVYAIDQLLANPTTIADKASGQTVPTAAAIEMGLRPRADQGRDRIEIFHRERYAAHPRRTGRQARLHRVPTWLPSD